MMSWWEKEPAVIEPAWHSTVLYVMGLLENKTTACVTCLFACLQLGTRVFHVEWFLWLHVKSVSALRFHSSLIFCVTGLRGSLCFSGGHRHLLPEWPTGTGGGGGPPPEWQDSIFTPGPVRLCHRARQKPFVRRGALQWYEWRRRGNWWAQIRSEVNANQERFG